MSYSYWPSYSWGSYSYWYDPSYSYSYSYNPSYNYSYSYDPSYSYSYSYNPSYSYSYSYDPSYSYSYSYDPSYSYSYSYSYSSYDPINSYWTQTDYSHPSQWDSQGIEHSVQTNHFYKDGSYGRIGTWSDTYSYYTRVPGASSYSYSYSYSYYPSYSYGYFPSYYNASNSSYPYSYEESLQMHLKAPQTSESQSQMTGVSPAATFLLGTIAGLSLAVIGFMGYKCRKARGSRAAAGASVNDSMVSTEPLSRNDIV